MGEAVSNYEFHSQTGSSECPEFAYCLFVKAGEEERTAAELSETTGCIPLVPMVERDERHSDKWERVAKKMLPGYVFLYSFVPIDPEPISDSSGVLRILRYTDESAELVGEDRRFAEWVYKNGGTVGVSTAVREGTKIRVIDGPLLDYRGSIIEVKRQKRTAKVAVSFGEITREIWMSFEWLESEEE